MKNIIRNKNFYLMLFADAVLVALAYSLAYLVRFEGNIPLQEMEQLKVALPFIVPLKLICFFILGLYRGMWRYTSLVDLRKVFSATSIASAVIILFILYQYRFQGYSRSVYVIDWGLTFMFTGGVRLLIRILLGSPLLSFWTQKSRRGDSSVKKLLIIGAGDAGEKWSSLREKYLWISMS